jgi:hypothetical protein
MKAPAIAIAIAIAIANTKPFFYRRHIWEQVGFLCQGYPPHIFVAVPSQALILHQSTLKVIKSSYLEDPWWETKLKNQQGFDSSYITRLNDIATAYKNTKAQLPADAQTFCRSIDPKPVEVVHYLTPTIEYSIIHKKLQAMFS